MSSLEQNTAGPTGLWRRPEKSPPVQCCPPRIFNFQFPVRPEPLPPPLEHDLRRSRPPLPAMGDTIRRPGRPTPALGANIRHPGRHLPSMGDSIRHTGKPVPAMGDYYRHPGKPLPSMGGHIRRPGKPLPSMGYHILHPGKLLPSLGGHSRPTGKPIPAPLAGLRFILTPSLPTINKTTGPQPPWDSSRNRWMSAATAKTKQMTANLNPRTKL